MNKNIAEHKMLLLFTLKNTKYPLTKHNLSIIMLDNLLMSFYNFNESMLSLKDLEFIKLDKIEDEEYAEITSSGLNTLELFESDIDEKKKEVILSYLNNVKENIIFSNNLKGTYTLEDVGRYRVKLQAKEGKNTIFNLAIEVQNEEEAKYICNNWKNNYSKIYLNILKSLKE